MVVAVDSEVEDDDKNLAAFGIERLLLMCGLGVGP